MSHLKNKTSDILNLAHMRQEPIFITKHGHGSLVVMSVEYYGDLEQSTERLEKMLGAQPPARLTSNSQPLGRKSKKRRRQITRRS
jgi:prevent-host-death family protein